jgi:hypothetical protein
MWLRCGGDKVFLCHFGGREASRKHPLGRLIREKGDDIKLALRKRDRENGRWMELAQDGEIYC